MDDPYSEGPESDIARRLLCQFLQAVLAETRKRRSDLGHLTLHATRLGRVFYRYHLDGDAIEIHPYYSAPRTGNAMRMRSKWFDYNESEGRWILMERFRDDILQEFVAVFDS